MSFYVVIFCLLLFNKQLIESLPPNTWHNATSLGRSYYYHDTCFIFGRSAAEDLCRTTHQADNVVGFPDVDTWNWVTNTLISSQPNGDCTTFGQAGGNGKWIGIGADCSGSSEKTSSLVWWNGDPFNNNVLSWRSGEPSSDCNGEKGILLGASSKAIEDANIGSHGYAVVCERALSTSHPTDSPTTSEPTTTNPTSNPTSNPSKIPSSTPTFTPTKIPTTVTPTENPSTLPSSTPTLIPTKIPITATPTSIPSKTPTLIPSTIPTTIPPYDNPSTIPTATPITIYPTISVTATNNADGAVGESSGIFTTENGNQGSLTEGDEGMDTIMLIVFVVFGVLLVIFCILMVVVYIKKKKRRMNTTKMMSTSDDTENVEMNVIKPDQMGSNRDGDNTTGQQIIDDNTKDNGGMQNKSENENINNGAHIVTGGNMNITTKQLIVCGDGEEDEDNDDAMYNKGNNETTNGNNIVTAGNMDTRGDITSFMNTTGNDKTRVQTYNGFINDNEEDEDEDSLVDQLYAEHDQPSNTKGNTTGGF